MTATSSTANEPVPRRLMTVLFVGVFMAALDNAVIGPVVPVLRATFGVDNREVGLVMSVFVLFSLCSTALLANLSDRYGRRPVYLASVGLFALGSLLIALSQSFWMLVVSRAIQGIGAGGITPTASAVVGDVFPPEGRGKALGLIGATYGMAFVLGPPLAGLLMVVLSWHWIFLINLPIAAVILYLGARALPVRGAAGPQPNFDWSGIMITFVLLIALVLGITQIADAFVNALIWPWMLIITAVMLVMLIQVEKRAEQPVIPFSLFANRQLAVTYLLTVGAGFGMGSVVFMTSIAHLAHDIAPKHTGFALLPMVVAAMLGSTGAGRLLNRMGARSLILIGFGLLAVGYGGSAITALGLWGFMLSSVPVGMGVGVVVGGALRTIVIDEAPLAVRGSAQGMINICTAIGTLLSAAAIGAVADFGGGGSSGFSIAYFAVSVLMLLMLMVTLALRNDRAGARTVASAA